MLQIKQFSYFCIHCSVFCKLQGIAKADIIFFNVNLVTESENIAQADSVYNFCWSAAIDDLISWGTDIKEYALQQALNGKEWKDWKVVEGRSNRKYTDEEKVAETVTKAGHNPYEQKLLGITAMTSLLGKTKFNELLGNLVYKPQGKPTLVPESDKRPGMNTSKDDFSEN